MKMQVIESVCDRCTKEVVNPLDERAYSRRDELALPAGWLHVSGSTATALVFEMDLCDQCKSIVLEAAGKARLS